MAGPTRAIRATPAKSFGPTPPRPPAPRPPVVADRLEKPAPKPPSRPSYDPNKPSSGGPVSSGERFPKPPSSGPGPSPAPSDGGGGGGRGGGDIDWRDAAYLAQIAAINRALADYETELGKRTGDYGTDYLTSLRQLGYRPGEGFSANVDIFSLPAFKGTDKKGKPKDVYPSSEAVAQAVEAAISPVTGKGAWDYEGEFTPFSAASKGTRSARDEFAGRGALRSSFFGKAYSDFQNRLQEQLTGMETGRSRFYRDAAIDLGQERASAEERRQAARRDAIMRAAMMAAG